MELDKIEKLLEKYLEASTTIAEEKELHLYFSLPNVAQHLEQYSAIFSYYKQAEQEKNTIPFAIPSKKDSFNWYSIAAALVVSIGIITFLMVNKPQEKAVANLGTFKSPEEAFQETQKALLVLSNHVNTGIEGVNYVAEYQKSKERIFN